MIVRLLVLFLVLSSGLIFCSKKDANNIDVIISYIDRYHSILYPFEHEKSVIHRINNIEQEAEQLVKLSKKILAEVNSNKKLTENQLLKEETQRLYELTSEFHKACMMNQEEAIVENIKNIRECLNSVTSIAHGISNSSE